MKADTFRILHILSELKTSPDFLITKKQNLAALVVIYSFIDICASFTKDGKQKSKENQKIFIGYINDFMQIPSKPPFSSKELWAARCSVLHSFSCIGRQHSVKETAEKIRPIYYYSWPENKDVVKAIIESNTDRGYLLLDTHDLYLYAIQAFNNFYTKIEKDINFEELVIKNGKHIICDLQGYSFFLPFKAIEKINSRS